jgi:heme/copper-type cytochrome/quinol oxidase subunit 2
VAILLACFAAAAGAAAHGRQPSLSRHNPSRPAPAANAARQDAPPESRAVHVVARKYSFSPARIEVQEGDLVKITLETADIPHSFAIRDEHYRMAKRAAPGHPAVFEFRADKPGTFPFYCSLTIDDGCRNMRGELVVKPKK